MNPTKKWTNLASDESIAKTIAALAANGIMALVTGNRDEAVAKVRELIPKGAEIMNQTSVTLETIGLAKEINELGNYNSVRNKLNEMSRDARSGVARQKLGAAPDWVIGSVHAVTEDGKVCIASNTGSQLPSYAYGSNHVIWVVGTQKIVKNEEEAKQRIYEHVLPLENERAKKAYGMGSNVSKLLMISKEVKPNRITVIFVKEVLGF